MSTYSTYKKETRYRTAKKVKCHHSWVFFNWGERNYMTCGNCLCYREQHAPWEWSKIKIQKGTIHVPQMGCA